MARILVVDDSAIDRRIAGSLLGKQPDWTVDYAQDGQEAIEKIESGRPDLVVTDLRMPNVNGLELVEAIKANHPGIPVVLMTGAGSETIAAEAIRKGAASYVPKNQLAAEIVNTARRLLSVSEDRHAQQRLAGCLSELQYVLETDLSLISSFMNDMRRLVKERELLQENDALCTLSALDEALSNAYYHGNLEVSSEIREEDPAQFYRQAEERKQAAPYRDRRIFVRARFDRRQLVFQIRDEGPGFDPARIPDPRAPGFLERPCGRGIFLMRSFVDEVRFNAAGNEVTLAKRTSSAETGDTDFSDTDISDTEHASDEFEQRRDARVLAAAELVQRSLLPMAAPAVAGFDIFGAAYPADTTCGDWFDWTMLPDGRLSIVVGDVSGHGLPAALLACSCSASFRTLMCEPVSLVEAIRDVDRSLKPRTRPQDFVVIQLARLDPVNRQFEYIGAGDVSLIIGKDGSLRHTLPASGPPIGLLAEASYGPHHHVPLLPGDIVLLLTDGFRNALSGAQGNFGFDRIQETVAKHATSSAEIILRAVYDVSRAESPGAVPADDMTGVVIRVEE